MGKSMMISAALLPYGSMSTAERIKMHVPRAQRISDKQSWFSIRDSAGSGPARMEIFDEIGFWGVSAHDLSAQLQDISASSIDVHINSPGGDVFDGIAILNILRGHPATIDVIVDGLAASAASFIAMAGDTITMMPNSQMMIHDASGICVGNPADMVNMADLLDKCSDNIASVYASRAGGSLNDWRAAMRTETWYSAEEAARAGLADNVASLEGVNNGDRTAFLNLWNMSLYMYDSRAAAPAPVQPSCASPSDGAGPVFNPDIFRAAMRAAVVGIPDRKAAQ